MGIEDRSYYRDSYESRMSFGFGGGGGGRSIVVTLILINVAFWVIDCFTNRPEVERVADGVAEVQQEPQGRKVQKPLRALSRWMAAETDIVSKPWLAWKLLTYGFAHSSLGSGSGIWHLLFNMLALFMLGRAVEDKLGKEEFLKFYLVSIVIAGTAWLLINAYIKQSPAIAVGASGAVSAVVGLFVFSFPRERILVWGIIAVPAWLLGVLMVGSDVLNSFNSSSNIAWEAHLAGFGFAAAYHYGKWNFRWIKTQWIQDRLSGKPNLKVHNPEASLEQLKTDADKILEKIHQQGEGSLTRKERRTLEKYSRKVREQQNS